MVNRLRNSMDPSGLALLKFMEPSGLDPRDAYSVDPKRPVVAGLERGKLEKPGTARDAPRSGSENLLPVGTVAAEPVGMVAVEPVGMADWVTCSVDPEAVATRVSEQEGTFPITMSSDG